MDQIEFVHLDEIVEELIVDLMNNEIVGKHLPLLINEFTFENCREFLNAKKEHWNEYGYGPWAFLINGKFAGWGGLQHEQGEADFALILHSDYWGWGLKIFNRVKDQAFNQMNLKSLTILLPPNRPNSKAVTRIGFTEDGQLNVDGEIFTRFRLTKDNASA